MNNQHVQSTNFNGYKGYTIDIKCPFHPILQLYPSIALLSYIHYTSFLCFLTEIYQCASRRYLVHLFNIHSQLPVGMPCRH